MIPTDTSSLYSTYYIINVDSNGAVALEAPVNRNGRWSLWVDHVLIRTMRTSRAMSFLDGWKLASAFGKQYDKAILLKLEETKSQQKEKFTTIDDRCIVEKDKGQ